MSSRWRERSRRRSSCPGREAAGQLEAVFERIAKEWGKLDFLVHSIAFSHQGRPAGRGARLPRRAFQGDGRLVWSFMRMAHLAEPLMKDGGTLFTMTYYGAKRWWRTTTSWAWPRPRSRPPALRRRRSSGPRASASTRSRRARSPPAPPRASRSSTLLLEKARGKRPGRRARRHRRRRRRLRLSRHDAARLMTGQVLYVDGGQHHGLASSSGARGRGSSRDLPSRHRCRRGRLMDSALVRQPTRRANAGCRAGSAATRPSASAGVPRAVCAAGAAACRPRLARSRGLSPR